MTTRIKFERGTGDKKYRAIVYKNDRKIKTVQFGSIKHGQYRDSTPLRLYASRDNLDPRRRRLYFQRHIYKKPRYSPGWLSAKYLWS